jgi:hypothetical protein
MVVLTKIRRALVNQLGPYLGEFMKTRILLLLPLLLLAFQNCGNVDLKPMNKVTGDPDITPTPTPPPTPPPANTKAYSVLVEKFINNSATKITGFDLTTTVEDKKVYEVTYSNGNSMIGKLSDMTNDRVDDFYVILQTPVVGATNYQIKLHNGANGALLNTYNYSSTTIGYILTIQNLEGDLQPEILAYKDMAATNENKLIIYDLQGNQKRMSVGDLRYGPLLATPSFEKILGDINNDGFAEIHLNVFELLSPSLYRRTDLILDGRTLDIRQPLFTTSLTAANPQTNTLSFLKERNQLVYIENRSIVSIYDINPSPFSIQLASIFNGSGITTTGSTSGGMGPALSIYNIAIDDELYLNHCEPVCTLKAYNLETGSVSSDIMNRLSEITEWSGNAISADYELFKINEDRIIGATMSRNTWPDGRYKYIVYNIDQDEPILNIDINPMAVSRISFVQLAKR